MQEASLRIHSSLRAERLLQRLLAFLATQGLPLGLITLAFFDERLGALRIIVEAGVDQGLEVDRLAPLGGEARAALVALAPDLPAAPLDGPAHDELERVTGHRPGCGLTLLLGLVGHPPGLLSLFGPRPLAAADAALVARLQRPLALALTHALDHRAVLDERARLVDDNRFLRSEAARAHGELLVGAEAGLRRVTVRLRALAEQDGPVWLRGEPGTGKGVAAQVLHDGSRRRDGQLVRLRCGEHDGISLERELFGDAGQPGRVERAHRGTLFLAGAGRLPRSVQQRLLRLVEHGRIERAGATLSVDVRPVLATVDSTGLLPQLVQQLRPWAVELPPLRERLDDIPALVRHFMQRRGAADVELSPGALKRLADWPWPGNVAELKHAVEGELLLRPRGPLFADDAEAPTAPLPLDQTLDQAMASHIRAVLEQCGGRVNGPGGAAQRLGIHPNTLRHRMRKLGISFGRRQSAG